MNLGGESRLPQVMHHSISLHRGLQQANCIFASLEPKKCLLPFPPRTSCAGMELYPRIGKHFDIKTWTNCRFGMMGWAVLILCYAVKQRALYGSVADSMVVSVLLMQIYICKFFV